MNVLNLIVLQMDNSQHMMDGWGGGSGMLFMGLIGLMILALIAVLIWFLIRKGSHSTSQSTGKSALEILNERYARGEIDEEEFRRRKKEINN